MVILHITLSWAALGLKHTRSWLPHSCEETVKEAPECMNDVVKNVQEELVEVNLSDEGKEKMVKISKALSEGKKRKLVALLKVCLGI